MRFPVFAGTSLAALLAIASTASANESGLPGYSGKPNPSAPAGETCSKCHSGGTAPTVMLMGPATLTYGQVASYSLVVTTGAVEAQGAVAATDGVKLMATSTGIRDSFDEVLPDEHFKTSGGKATFTFKVTAPTTGAAIKLWAVGLADNANNGTGGDATKAITMDITLPGTATAADAGADGGVSTTTDAGGEPSADSGTSSSGSTSSTSGSSGTSSSGGTEDDAGESTSSSSSGGMLPGDESGGCSVSGSTGYGSALFFAAIGMIPFLARRRRRRGKA